MQQIAEIENPKSKFRIFKIEKSPIEKSDETRYIASYPQAVDNPVDNFRACG
jgi:hypothetical protein